MKNLFLMLSLAGSLLINASCDKDKDDNGGPCDLPSSAPPAGMAGAWVKGGISSTILFDTYDGKYVGTGFKTGQYLKFDQNGKNAELLLLVDDSQYSGLQSATRMYGNIVFDETEGTLEFQVCRAHYRGWRQGKKTIDRPANDTEVKKLRENNKFWFVYDETSNYPLKLWFQSLPVNDNTTNSFVRS